MQSEQMPDRKMKVTVLGAGSFGTAMAMSCARNKVRLRRRLEKRTWAGG